MSRRVELVWASCVRAALLGIIVCLLVLISKAAFAGQEELERDLAKAKIDRDYVLKSCKDEPKDKRKECENRVEGYYIDITKGLRAKHLNDKSK